MDHKNYHEAADDCNGEGNGECIERSRFESDDSVKVKSQDVPSVYVPFGTRPKHIVPISDDNISEDDAEYDTPKKVPQPQPRDVEIAYEPRPWRRSLSQTSYSSKNSRGSWTSRTSSRGSQGRSNQEKQQRPWRTHSVEDFDDGSIASYRSYDSRSSLMSHGSSDLFMERSTSLRKASKKNPFEGGLVDGRPSLEKIFAIVDQVHKEKQTRLATLKEGRRTVEKLPGGPNEVDQDDCSSGKGNINDGSTKSSFRRGAGGGHSVRIGGTTTFGDDGTATNSRNDIARSNYFIHKKKKGSKTTDNSYLKLRHSLQKESSLKKAKIDVAAIASLQVEKFYTERQKAEKQHEKKLKRSDMLLSGGRSESVARLKQSSLKSSLSLTEEDMKEFIAQSIIQSDPLPDAKTSEMGGTELETNASLDDEVKEEKKGIFSLFSKKYLGHSSRKGDNDNSNESKDTYTECNHGNLNLEGSQSRTRGASIGRRFTLGKIFSSAIHRANVLLSSLSLVPLSSECYSHPRHKVRHDFNMALLTARREFLSHQSRQCQLYTD